MVLGGGKATESGRSRHYENDGEALQELRGGGKREEGLRISLPTGCVTEVEIMGVCLT
jgi:hypothetical protein